MLFYIRRLFKKLLFLDGEEKTSAFYTELEGVNPQCVVDKKPSKYYVACVEDCILSIGNPEMEAIMFERFPKFEILFRKLSEELLVKIQVSFDDFKTSSPEQRYLKLQQSRPDLIQRIPQHQLASFLGIKPQSLSRIRARILEKEKSKAHFLT